ncbi:MAG TPA: hypothetical protein VEQ59_25210 [Polyangiaceae bacterium]|nr:hypothetical protein [Polyangiaceae bacterium]
MATPPPSGAAALRTDLERELSLLERARTRLSEGYAAAALDLLNAHRSSYPRSALTQEREALTVKALSAAGRADEAREAGEAFSRRFPKSVLRPSVDRATEGSP